MHFVRGVSRSGGTRCLRALHRPESRHPLRCAISLAPTGFATSPVELINRRPVRMLACSQARSSLRSPPSSRIDHDFLGPGRFLSLALRACKLLRIRHITGRWRLLKRGTSPFRSEAPGAKLYLLHLTEVTRQTRSLNSLTWPSCDASREALIKHAGLCRRRS